MTIDLTRDEAKLIRDCLENAKLRSDKSEMADVLIAKLGKKMFPSAISGDWGQQFHAAWQRHHKRNGQVFQVVLQTVIAKAEKIDWQRFEENHPAYCLYWDRTGWQYNPETLMDWIDNGMQAPPPEAEPKTNSRVRRLAERR